MFFFHCFQFYHDLLELLGFGMYAFLHFSYFPTLNVLNLDVQPCDIFIVLQAVGEFETMLIALNNMRTIPCRWVFVITYFVRGLGCGLAMFAQFWRICPAPGLGNPRDECYQTCAA